MQGNDMPQQERNLSPFASAASSSGNRQQGPMPEGSPSSSTLWPNQDGGLPNVPLPGPPAPSGPSSPPGPPFTGHFPPSMQPGFSLHSSQATPSQLQPELPAASLPAPPLLSPATRQEPCSAPLRTASLPIQLPGGLHSSSNPRGLASLEQQGRVLPSLALPPPQSRSEEAELANPVLQPPPQQVSPAPGVFAVRLLDKVCWLRHVHLAPSEASCSTENILEG